MAKALNKLDCLGHWLGIGTLAMNWQFKTRKVKKKKRKNNRAESIDK